jgi:hypothetical protein
LSASVLHHHCGNELAEFAPVLLFFVRAAPSVLETAVIDNKLKLSFT